MQVLWVINHHRMEYSMQQFT